MKKAQVTILTVLT